VGSALTQTGCAQLSHLIALVSAVGEISRGEKGSKAKNLRVQVTISCGAPNSAGACRLRLPTGLSMTFMFIIIIISSSSRRSAYELY
jgi:hypothetical protein